MHKQASVKEISYVCWSGQFGNSHHDYPDVKIDVRVLLPIPKSQRF